MKRAKRFDAKSLLPNPAFEDWGFVDAYELAIPVDMKIAHGRALEALIFGNSYIHNNPLLFGYI